jgi:hypothetical protein
VNAALDLSHGVYSAVNVGMKAAGSSYRFPTEGQLQPNGPTQAAAERGMHGMLNLAAWLAPLAKVGQAGRALGAVGEAVQSGMARSVASGAAREAQNVTAAIADTIITPTPGLGHSKLGDAAATALWAGFNYFSVM